MRISANLQWQKLLYLNKQHSSLVKKDKFFISKERTPLAELKATLKAFRSGKSSCDFPARFLYLKRHFPELKPKNCKKYQDWLRQIRGEKVSLVFASQYITNPVSSFGHIFLRFSSGWMPQNMDPTFSYAANVPDDISTLVYGFKGIFGGFKGEFNVMPAYYNIHTYNNLENRDLWFYELNITKQQRSFMLAHLWELINLTSFDYYFFNHNCAGMLLMLLSTVQDDLKLYPEGAFYLAPSEAVKIVYENNLIKKVEFKPSLRGRVEHLVAKMSANEKASFISSYKNLSLPNNALVLDALLEKLTMDRYEAEGKLTPKKEAFESLVLEKRAQYKEKFELPQKNLDLGPHKSHEFKLLKLEAGKRASEEQYNLSFRSAAHDLLDRSAGFLPHSKIKVLEGSVGFSQETVFVDDLTLVSFANFQDWPEIGSGWSWSLDLSWGQDPFGLPGKYRGLLGGFFGASVEIKNFIFYGGLKSEGLVGSSSIGHLVTGPEIGSFVSFKNSKLWTNVQLARSWGGFTDTILKGNVQLRLGLNKKWSVFTRASLWQDLDRGREIQNEFFIGPGLYF